MEIKLTPLTTITKHLVKVKWKDKELTYILEKTESKGEIYMTVTKKRLPFIKEARNEYIKKKLLRLFTSEI